MKFAVQDIGLLIQTLQLRTFYTIVSSAIDTKEEQREQKMANLHSCRLNECASFTHCRLDMFGPIIVKQRRSEVKCYGAMFT